MRLSSCSKDHCGRQHLKYWLSGPLQKKLPAPGRTFFKWGMSGPEGQSDSPTVTWALAENQRVEPKSLHPSPAQPQFSQAPSDLPPAGHARQARCNPGQGVPGCPFRLAGVFSGAREKGYWAAQLHGRDICSGDGPGGQELSLFQPDSWTHLATLNKRVRWWR